MVNMLTANTDINSIAQALASQIPEINAKYDYKLPNEDESENERKHFLHYYTEGKEEVSPQREIKMYWYERPAEANDLVLVSYKNNAVKGFHPWLKCFRLDRKTGALSAADLPFTLRQSDFGASASSQTESAWRTDYKICENGSIVVSASPAMAQTNVMLVRWDNKTGFTVYRRGVYNSQGTILRH